MLSAKELRNRAIEKKKHESEERKGVMKEYYDKFIDKLCSIIYNTIEENLDYKPNKLSFKLYDPFKKEEKMFGKFHWKYLYYGYMIEGGKEFNKDIHKELHIDDPIKDVNDKLEKYNFSIEDVSNPEKSNMLVLQIFIKDDKELEEE
jgi:hypothetical protein